MRACRSTIDGDCRRKRDNGFLRPPSLEMIRAFFTQSIIYIASLKRQDLEKNLEFTSIFLPFYFGF